MATPYSDVIDIFLIKVSDYDLPKLEELEREEIVSSYMKSACSKFKSCKVNLDDVNDELKQFNQSLTFDIIDIISEGMITEWLKPKVMNSEILKNSLSTKDFSLYSPANLLKEMRETLKISKADYRSMINDYSFKNADFTKLGG